MKQGTNGGGKLAWFKPELRRIDAGSAEASQKSGVPDGPGGNPNNKNFS
jgi:hypothetical protein